MPSPSAALQRPDLGQTFEEFSLEASRRGFIGDLVLPAIDVAQQTANVGKIPIEALLSERDTKRTLSGGYARGNYKFETFNYATKEHGAEEPIDDREQQIYRRYIDAEMVATQRALDVVLRNRERRIADAVFNASTWTGSTLFTSITDEWDDYGNAIPITDIDAAVEKVFSNSGLKANALICNEKVLKNLRNCEQIVDRLKFSGQTDPRMPVSQLAAILAPLFDLERIIVASSPRNSGNPGQSSATISRIWSGEYAMVCKVATSNDMREPCIGRSFHYTGDGSAIDGRVETYRDETIRGNVVRVRHETDEVIMYAAAGHLLGNATT